MKKPNYATGLHERDFCRWCNKGRYVRPIGPWHACDGGGPYQDVQCGSCKEVTRRYEPCMHDGSDPSCLVWQRSRAPRGT